MVDMRARCCSSTKLATPIPALSTAKFLVLLLGTLAVLLAVPVAKPKNAELYTRLNSAGLSVQRLLQNKIAQTKLAQLTAA
jgi:hypothetical protein